MYELPIKQWYRTEKQMVNETYLRHNMRENCWVDGRSRALTSYEMPDRRV
jgi:hypothetical protein